MNIGTYVKYRGSYRLITRKKGNLVFLSSPTEKTVLVNPKNCEETCHVPAKVVIDNLSGDQYVVTVTGNIFSCRTSRLMKWAENHPIRKRLLEAANVSV